MKLADEIRQSLGGVFLDKENTYFSSGKDWWSIAYMPEYPKHTARDKVVENMHFVKLHL